MSQPISATLWTLLLFTGGCLSLAQHVAAQTRAGSTAKCPPVEGLAGLLEPGRVLVLGEIHGTTQSPAFALQVACNVLEKDLALVVGLELESQEQNGVDRFLASAGSQSDRGALLAQSSWSRAYQDGRNSEAMFELIEGLRRLGQQRPVDVVLFSAAYNAQRDSAMASTLAAAAMRRPTAVTLVLTGNFHSRVVANRRTEPMAAVMSRMVGGERVVALDVAHGGGTAWLCLATENGQECGAASLKARWPSEGEGITLLDSPAATAHHGWYRVGDLVASPPAKGGAPEDHGK